MIEHTPTPWILGDYCIIEDEQGFSVKLISPWVEEAWYDDGEAEANARFIVMACNHFEEMTKELGRIRMFLRRAIRLYPGDITVHHAEVIDSVTDLLRHIHETNQGKSQ